MLAQQHAVAGDAVAALEQAQARPQTHGIVGEHGLAEFALQLFHHAHRRPIAARHDNGVGIGAIGAAAERVGGLRAGAAELALALMLASRRNVALEAERMKRGEWPCTLSHRLRGSTLGIFGLGAIGGLVAQGGRGLGMEILVWGQKASLQKAEAAGYARAADKAALFERSDVLSLHVRLTRDTHGIVGADDLDRMKPTALIVNTARAELIAPGALLAALRKGRPGYAAVDVYDHEPVTGGDHPFLSMPNVLCTPHLGWAEWENFELYFREAFEQIVAYEQARPLRLANPDVLLRR